MQYHFNGFQPGDPDISPVDSSIDCHSNTVDVLIVGCGPAGLTLAAQLARIGGVSVRIFERKTGPLEVGQADGIACRSMEMFEAFGFVEQVQREAYWVNETVFWRPDASGQGLHRADRIQDVEDDLSHQPHVILSQARIHDFFLACMKNSALQLVPDYGKELVDVRREEGEEYPVKAVFRDIKQAGHQETVSAKFLVGCDGARSSVRSLLGYSLKGEAARQLWGVMDVLAITTFPDIRLKCAIQSAESGSILIIPREGGYLVRLYIELDELHDNERAADRAVTPELLISKAKKILQPFAFEVKEVAWWSAYEIGQRNCDSFDDTYSSSESTGLPRIFIAGDACHTHSPKAGQGMNVSMADTFNLGWKLAAVIKQQAGHELLKSYSEERHAKAKELIDFDRDMARLFSKKPDSDDEKALFQQYFQKHARYTAGVETQYEASVITSTASYQSLATGLVVGKRFHSAPVIRLADAKPVQLAEALPADGRWRIIAFADANDRGSSSGAMARLCQHLQASDQSPVVNFTPKGSDIDSVIDVRAVFQQSHRDLELQDMPALLLPEKGKLHLTDYEKIYAAVQDEQSDIFKLRGLHRQQGAVVVVRPDQYVADVLPLDAYQALSDFFSQFMQKIV